MRRQLIAAIVLMVTTAFPAFAEDFSIFTGHWKGSGISETEDSIYFAVTVRDMDVVISPVDNGGFSLSWTTVTRESGDPNNPDIKRSDATIIFRPTGVPGVYRDEAIGDPLKSEPVWWSRVEGDSLYTYMLRIRENGTWQVQKYIRTITGQGMTLTYQRISDGEAERQVRGRLVKHSE